MSDITSTLQGLGDGTVTTDQATAMFAARQWPVRLAHQPPALPGDDLAEDVADGSFGEVQAAYAAGWITDEQYAQLAQAAASAGAVTGFGGGDGQQDDLFAPEMKGIPLAKGSYCGMPGGGRGRITEVVTEGQAKGSDGTTADSPAAVVAVWEKGDDGWSATGKTTAVKLSALKDMPPPRPLAGAGGESKAAGILEALTGHELRTSGQPPWARPAASAVTAVYERGTAAYPGESKALMPAHDWAMGRVGAFLGLAAGEQTAGYARDHDLLPEGHPARAGTWDA
ncbi:MAG TPA: hypothetical protein VGG54_22850 [Trebonia sp.]|jgi:hypothetical protein